MIEASAIAEIIGTYKKYGWVLRRVLLSPALATKLGTEKDALFGDAAITGSAVDAAWFSRPPQPGDVAWEVRYLGDTPYALLVKVDESDPEFENMLQGVEEQLRDYVAAKQTA
jgi:hypothetical protein